MATVLVVDDEEAIVGLLTELVIDAGHTALPATNGHDALALARQHHPALIISDVLMPVMDGHALLQALRADPDLGDTPVVLISATFRPEQLDLGIPTAHLSKPLDLSLIDSFLQRLP